MGRPANEYDEIGMQLTYTDQDPIVDADAYKITNDEKCLLEYRRIMRKEMKALLQALRRKKQTKLGIKWRFSIKMSASCLHFDKDKPEPERDRLHMHILIRGSHCETIAEFIRKYWRKKHDVTGEKASRPIVKYKKIDGNWLSGYMDKQAFMTKEKKWDE